MNYKCRNEIKMGGFVILLDKKYLSTKHCYLLLENFNGTNIICVNVVKQVFLWYNQIAILFTFQYSFNLLF